MSLLKKKTISVKLFKFQMKKKKTLHHRTFGFDGANFWVVLKIQMKFKKKAACGKYFKSTSFVDAQASFHCFS